MSGHGAPARHLSHFFVESDGSSYQISVQDGKIHISGKSFKNYEEEGVPKVERLQGTELTVTYTWKHNVLQTADIKMDCVDDEGALDTCKFSIPATWPACMLPEDASETQQSHNQLPALLSFFEENVRSGMLVETRQARMRTLQTIHSYTYSVKKDSVKKDSVKTDMKQCMPQNPYFV